LSLAGALALGASLLAAAPALAATVPGSLSSLGCVGVSGSGTSCDTELPAGLDNLYETALSPDGANAYEAVLGNEIAEFSRDGSSGTLSPLSSPSDCIAAPDGGLTTDECAQQTASGLNGVAALVVSPDGKNLYAIGQADDAVVAFSRDASTGALTQLSTTAACISEDTDSASSCANQTGYGLADASGITVSPDGLDVYVTSSDDHAVAEFRRDRSSGALTEFACQSDSTYTDGSCTATADGLENAIGVQVSPDGQNVYVAAGGTGGGGDIAEFSRDTTMSKSSPDYGELSQLPYPDDCITSAAALDPNVQCGDSAATAIDGPDDLTLSPDGSNLYANSFDANAVLEFSRDATTGALFQLPAPNDCISSSAASGCGSTDAPSLQGPLGVAISPEGFSLYVADSSADAVTTLTRNPSTGALDQLASPEDCVTADDSGCGTDDVPGLTGARRLSVSADGADGADVYVAAQNAPAIVELARTLPSADIGIAESGAPAAATPGDAVTYTYTITNSGPSDSGDAIVNIALPATTVLDVAGSSQGSCSGSANIVCDLGLLAAGQSATVTVKVDMPSAGTFAATASVRDSTDVTDPDGANDTVVTSTNVGLGSGTGVYVTQRDDGASANVASMTLGSFDAALSTPVFAGSGGAASFGIAVTPDGAHVYVTNDNGASSLSQYSVDSATGELTALDPASVEVSHSSGANPEDVAIDPTGRWVYVANPGAASVSQLRIDPATGALTMVDEFRSQLISSPTGVAFSPDGRSLYVADFGAGDIVEFDVDPHTGELSPKSEAIAALPQPVGDTQPQPRRLVTAAVGGHDYLYATDYDNGLIDEFAIDPSSGELTLSGDLQTNASPTGLAVDTATTPASLYVASEGAGLVNEYDIATSSGALSAKATVSIRAGSDPDGVALAPDDNELYVGDNGDDDLYLYTIAADGTLSADSVHPQFAVGSGPSTVVVHALPAPAVTPATPTGGSLQPLAAPNDCLTANPFGCNTLITPAGGLDHDYQTVVSPDGKNVYAAAWLGDLVEFGRDPSTGALSEIGCFSDGGAGCTQAPGANNPRSIALSPDGDYLYEVGSQNELTMFSRDPSSGQLSWIGCLTSPGAADSRCSGVADGLEGPNSVAVSPDGASVYVTSGDDSSVAWFTRDPASGLLTQPASPDDCISSDNTDPAGCAIDTAAGLDDPVTVAVSPDGSNVYVSAGGLGPDGDVAEFSRDPATGALTQLAPPNDCLAAAGSSGCGNTSVPGFGGEEDIAISPDGHNVYLNSFANSAVIELSRDSSTGALAPLAAPNDCITSDATNPGGCGDTSAVALNGVQGLAISADGLDLYAAASGPAAAGGAFNAVDELKRNPRTGALTQAAAPFDCLTENGSGCGGYNVNGLGQPRRLAVSPDGRDVYVAAQEGTLVELARTAPSADLAISQSGAAGTASVGDQITYTYTVSDLGPSAADDALVSVPLDSDESIVSATSSRGSCSVTLTVSCDLGPLLNGDVVTVTVTADANSAGTASVDATVADATDVTDPDTSNNDASASTVVSGLDPANTAAPEISGTATAGQTLSASTGTWDNSPGSFDYNWEDCSDNSGNGCVSVQSGASDEYTLQDSDEGAFVEVLVTATNDNGNDIAESATLGPVTGSPANTAAPSISGTQSAGDTLTASAGTWSGYPQPTFTYDWQECTDGSGNGCVSVQSGASEEYTLGANDEGLYLEVVVTATNGESPDASATSAETAAIEGAPAESVLPTIAGNPIVGDTLTATPGTWSGYPAPTFTYTWQDCPDSSGNGCTTVQSGSDEQYQLLDSDAGSLVRLVVSASNGAGPDASADSALTDTVTQAPANSAAPSIAGSPSVGTTLTASAGTWSGYPAPTFTYVWQDCPDDSGNGCTTMQSGSSDQYDLADADAGSLVQVVVTASNGTDPDATAASDFTDVVTHAPANSLAPSISGGASVGGTLTAFAGTWSGYPAPTFTYLWQDCPDDSGNGCTTVQSGSSDRYDLLGADAGSLVRVIVTASNGTGSDVTADSDFTAAVTQAPSNTVLPSIAGSTSSGETLTASPGAWSGAPAPTFTYTWQDCPDDSGDGCTTAQSGSSDQYDLTDSDAGSLLRVVVTATNGNAPDASADSAFTDAVTQQPANTALPSLSGNAALGDSLSATSGSWSGYPAPSFTYSWEDCPDNSGNGCTTIDGAISNSYVLAASDEGSMVRVLVKASNGVGSDVSVASGTSAAITAAPANTVLPSISGSATAGQSLTASAGTWTGYPAPTYTYTWQDCPDTSGNGCTTVASDASDQYTPGVSDEGLYVQVTVSATNGSGPDSSATSVPVGQVTGPPANTSSPTITGTASSGETLSATPGDWSGFPIPAFNYAWQACPDNSGNGCTTVQSGASSQYTPAVGDEGSLIRVLVTASNNGGENASATSDFTSAVTGPPANTSLPAISGATVAGQTLSASTGNWSGYPAPTYTYLWQDCPDNSGNGCTTVQSGASNDYTLQAADERSHVNVVVSATNGIGSDASATSATTAAVTGSPANTAAPTISGSASQGQTLTASPGTWTANPSATYTYLWQDCPDNSGNGCTTVQSGSSTQYALLSSDEGSLVRVSVTATNSLGHASATSSYTDAVTGPSVEVAPPAVTGSATAGQTLHASNGTWSGYPAPSFTYSWQDCPDSTGNGCSTIAGALSNSYVLTDTDEGSTVLVIVKATNGVGADVSVPSATTAVVVGAPANSVSPSISGSASAGQTLSAAPGTWTGNPAPSFSYAWQDCPDDSGNGCTTVQSGASNQYAIQGSDQGSLVRVVVTASNGVGTVTATSALTSSVTAGPLNGVAPAISGTASAGQTLSATSGIWSGSPAPTYTYAWQDCTSSAASACATVQSGASNQYLLSASDSGLFVRVVVTATNGVGSDATAASATTAAVTSAPTNSQAPSISGTAQQGVPLSAAPGTWSGVPTPALSYEWEDCDANGDNCNPVAASGNSLSYTPTTSDIGDTLVLSVTGSNAAGQLTVASAATAEVLIAAPANTAAPTISGSAEMGDTVSASTGTWEDSPTSFTYAWMRCDSAGNACAGISGASSSSYLATGADVGATLRVTVTASNAGGPTSVTSAPTAMVLIAAPVDTTPPAISGTLGQGQLLTASNGQWTPSPTGFSYQWEQCDSAGNNCANIGTATTGNYVVQPGDVGHTLRVIVTASDSGGNTAATSAPSPLVGTLPTNTAPPTLTGADQQGQTLTATSGSWNATPAPTFTYSWKRCDSTGNNCTPIAGASAPGYTPGPADVGSTLVVTVTATNTAGSTTATITQAAPIMIAAPAISAPPVISGNAVVGQPLSVSNGSWTNSPSAYGYQWAQCDGSGNGCSPIAGATAASYTASAGDAGHTLEVTVTATNAGGTATALSASSSVVSSAPPSVGSTPPPNAGAPRAVGAPANTTLPAISGTAGQGRELSLSNGSWTNSPTAFSYKWLRCNSAGASCSPVAGATGNKYVPAAADGGHTLRATVTASNVAGGTAATSAKTASVKSLQVSVAAPILGETTDLAPVSGTVLVKLPGSGTFAKLTSATDLPLGTTIDTTHGKVRLTVGLADGRTQAGEFYDGKFVLTQTSSGRTVLTLAGGSYAGCPAPDQTQATEVGATGGRGATGSTGASGASGSAAATAATTTEAARIAAAKTPTTVIRQLSGDAHGNFTTKGRYGSASVNGTIWLTQDRCDGTYVRVTKDKAIVTANAQPQTKHNIKQGHSILVPPPVN
jgi:uncharacterized repeat protein (TIGR01451 family)